MEGKGIKTENPILTNQLSSNTKNNETDDDSSDEATSPSSSQDSWGFRPILHSSAIEDEFAEYKPSIVIINPPPSWAKKFSTSILARVGDDRSLQPAVKCAGEFIPLQLSKEEQQEASVELTIMRLLTSIRDKVENSGDEEKNSSSEDNVSSSPIGSIVDESSQNISQDLGSSELALKTENADKLDDVKPSQSKRSTQAASGNCEEAGVEELSIHERLKMDSSDLEVVDLEEGEISDGIATELTQSNHFDDLRSKINSKKHEVNILKRKPPSAAENDYSDVKLTKYRKLFVDQVEIVSVADKLNQMRRNGIGTDCEVNVGDRTYHCHSLILMRNSTYLRDLFREKSTYSVEIEDVTPEVFQIILDYLYLSNVNLKSYGEARQVLAASLALRIPELVKICTKFCTQQLLGDQSTFWPALDSLLKDQPEPYQLNLSQISTLNTLLISKEFLNIDINTLNFIVEQKFFIRCYENILITSVEEWAKHHLQNSKIEVNLDNLRSILGRVFFKLRYFSLSQKDLCALFKKTQLLTESEKLYLLEWSVTRTGNPQSESLCTIKYSRGTCSSGVLRLPKFSGASYLSVYDANKVNCSFFFTPTSDMLLLTFDYFSQIPPVKTRSNVYNEEFTAQILRIDENRLEVLREVHSVNKVEYDSIIRVKMPVPVLLRKGRRSSYGIKLILSSAGKYKMLKNNFWGGMNPFEKNHLKPLKSDWSWGNDGIFSALSYKIMV
ncbi:Hypothetical predicted protein [Cloeon dipterum]|uniref:BTB domain-containing protein n=1 Tax=Cloeon dipterum TaxID=197152 RepID=A0A8S1CLV0_9INSE|nr:Hypothetical predicted protein [Cloeon dipterum]